NLATPLAQGNRAQRHGQHAQAIRHYAAGLRDDAQASAHGPIAVQLAHNLRRARQGYRRHRQAALQAPLQAPQQAGGKLQVVVCCWSLSENPAGRAYTIASLYQDLVEHPDPPPAPGIGHVTLIGSRFARRGYQLWVPLDGTRHESVPRLRWPLRWTPQWYQRRQPRAPAAPRWCHHPPCPRPGPIPALRRAALETEQARGRLALRLLDDQPFAAIPELKRVVMLTLRATLEPDGQIKLPPHVRHQEPVSVLITFLEEPISAPGEASAATTLALLRSPAFQSLPTSDPNEIEQRIADLRNDWSDD
ncbi:hypothetical protein Thi970DRAFT_00397, partial [Thiorhodovibrio frisius]